MINGEKYPFVIYIFGMLGREYLVVLSNFSQLVAAKIDKLILYGWGWINDWIVIMVARSSSRMICGDRLPSPLWDQDPDWYPESGLGLSQ